MTASPIHTPDSKLSHGRVDQAKPVGVVIGQVPVSEHHLHDLVKAQQDTLADAPIRFCHRASSSHRECIDLQEKHSRPGPRRSPLLST